MHRLTEALYSINFYFPNFKATPLKITKNSCFSNEKNYLKSVLAKTLKINLKTKRNPRIKNIKSLMKDTKK